MRLGRVSRFLGQFTPRGVRGILTGLKCPGRNLEQPLLNGQPVVADQADVILVHQRDNRHGARMFDYFA